MGSDDLFRLGWSFKPDAVHAPTEPKVPHRLPNHRIETAPLRLFGGLPLGPTLHRAGEDTRLTARLWLALGKWFDL